MKLKSMIQCALYWTTFIAHRYSHQCLSLIPQTTLGDAKTVDECHRTVEGSNVCIKEPNISSSGFICVFIRSLFTILWVCFLIYFFFLIIFTQNFTLFLKKKYKLIMKIKQSKSSSWFQVHDILVVFAGFFFFYLKLTPGGQCLQICD